MSFKAIGLIFFLLLFAGLIVFLFAPDLDFSRFSLGESATATVERNPFGDVDFNGKIKGSFSGKFVEDVETVMPNATIEKGYFNGTIENDDLAAVHFEGEIIGGVFNGRVYDGSINKGNDWDGKINGFVYHSELTGNELIVVPVKGDTSVEPLLIWSIIIILIGFGLLLSIWFWKRKSDEDYYGDRDSLTEEDRKARNILLEYYDYPIAETDEAVLISDERDEHGKIKPREALFGYITSLGELAVVRMRSGNLVKLSRNVSASMYVEEFTKRSMKQTIDVSRLHSKINDYKAKRRKEKLTSNVDDDVVVHDTRSDDY
ncbi:MAG: hypothetical protein U9M89_01330 [Patescibacteria group bacterium]|nr:hypothetical protein [Patescibacteria group bacterium]